MLLVILQEGWLRAWLCIYGPPNHTCEALVIFSMGNERFLTQPCNTTSSTYNDAGLVSISVDSVGRVA